MKPDRELATQVRGGARLVVDAVRGVTGIVEGVHGSVVRRRPPIGRADERPLGGITGFVYRSVHGVTSLVGQGVDAALAGAERLLPPQAAGAEAPARLAVVSAINGVLGDHLERSGNPLAIPMQIGRGAATGPRPALLIHGLCMNDQQWTRDGHDHGRVLQDLGFSPRYLRYNTGRHISANGESLALLLESLLADWPAPVEDLTLVGHSMGGLVARSALHQAQVAGLRWPARLRQLVFLGTPHHGASLERAGNRVHTALGVSPYAAPFARLSGVRSDGITDLRHGNLLRGDWSAGRFDHRDVRQPVPLPAGVRCFAVAGTLGREAIPAWRNDGLVSVDSALGRHADADRALHFEDGCAFVAEGVGHLDLLSSGKVADHLRYWLGT